jgi:hypothetical protein
MGLEETLAGEVRQSLKSLLWNSRVELPGISVVLRTDCNLIFYQEGMLQIPPSSLVYDSPEDKTYFFGAMAGLVVQAHSNPLVKNMLEQEGKWTVAEAEKYSFWSAFGTARSGLAVVQRKMGSGTADRYTQNFLARVRKECDVESMAKMYAARFQQQHQDQYCREALKVCDLEELHEWVRPVDQHIFTHARTWGGDVQFS